MLLRRIALRGSPEFRFASGAVVSGVESAGATSVTLPAHSFGDIIIVFAYRDGNVTQPTLPAGFTAISNAAGANVNSSTLGYKIAANSSETSGTWANASAIMAVVINGSVASGIGNSSTNGGSDSRISYTTVSLGGTRHVICFAGHRSVNVAVEEPLYGMLRVGSFVNATCELACHITNGPVASFAGGISPGGGGTVSGFRSHSVELVS